MGKMKKTVVIKAPIEEVWKMFAYPENVLKIFEELKRRLSDAAEGLKELLLRQVEKLTPDAVIFFQR